MFHPRNLGLRRLNETDFAKYLNHILPTTEPIYLEDDANAPDTPHVRKYRFQKRETRYAFVIRTGVLCFIPITINDLLGTDFDHHAAYKTLEELMLIRNEFVALAAEAIRVPA